MMTDIRDYLLIIDRDKVEALQVAKRTAARLETQQLTLVGLIESLGEYINDENSAVRFKTVGFLAEIIGNLTSTFLTGQEVQVLCHFLCERMEDEGAIGGLRKLQELRRFNNDMAIMTFRAILRYFPDLKIRPQSQRLQILQLLNDLLLKQRSAIKSLAAESLMGITDLVNGEKDPRNLMIIFSIMKVVIMEWDIVDHAQALFDSVFCYFPITFRPPPDDPYGITAQDLKYRLRDCLAASQHFAPYVFPQLIDKLDSGFPNVKKDVLQSITACVLSYDVRTVAKYSSKLWDSLKYEILNFQEEDLATEAFVPLQSLTLRLSSVSETTDQTSALANYLKLVIKECNDLLQEPQQKKAKPAGQIISSIATASQPAFCITARAVIPPLVALYQSDGTIAKQSAILEVFAQLLESAEQVYSPSARSNPLITLNPLEPFRERLFGIFSQALMSGAKEELSFRLLALKCLLHMCSIYGLLQESEIGMVVQYYIEIILQERTDAGAKIRTAAIDALIQISRSKPALIMDITFPACMALLPDSSSQNQKDYLTTLEGLALISVERSLCDTLVRRLFNIIDSVLHDENSLLYAQAILSTLFYVLSRRDLSSDSNLEFYYERIVKLVKRSVEGAYGISLPTVLNNSHAMEGLGRLINLTLRVLPDQHSHAVQQIYKLFTNTPDLVPVLFHSDASEHEQTTLILSTYILAAIDKHIPLPFSDALLHSILNALIEWSKSDIPNMVRLSILRQVALYINKFMAGNKLYIASNLLWTPSIGLFENSDLSEGSIQAVFWITKAMTLQLEQTEEILHRLLDLASHPIFGTKIARGFALLLAPDELLAKHNGAVIRLLSKQKVFMICLSAITKAFRNAEDNAKSNYLIALSGLLEFLPVETLMPEVNVLLPLLIQSLELDDQIVKETSIQTLTVVSQQSPKAVEEHMSSIVKRLLSLIVSPDRNLANVRYNALRCLQCFPGKVTDSTLLPYRKAVIKKMLTALDDPKRNVRKEAVDCRSAWLNMDEPTQDD